MRLLAIVLLLFAGPAAGEVVHAEAGGFEIAASQTVAAPPETVWRMLVDPQRWWDGAHSYSGEAANLSLDPQAGGCFCERLPDGSVEHARVVFAQRGETLRLYGALGPLQELGVVGALTFTLVPNASGTRITMRYVVGGYVPGGAGALAAPVDHVMTGQLRRLAAAVDRS